MKHIKKVKPADPKASGESLQAMAADGSKTPKPEVRLVKDLRPCIPIDG